MSDHSESENMSTFHKIKQFVSPIITGILIAWAGFVGNLVLQSTETRRENARLLTELQVRREELESQIRQEIFSHTIETLLAAPNTDSDFEHISRDLMHLELLALNFGDSLSLAPLFSEYNRKLNSMKSSDSFSEDNIHVETYKKRLRSLAKRVADGQLDSLENHGAVKQFDIPLAHHHSPTSKCKHTYFGGDSGTYRWPEDEVYSVFGEEEIASDKQLEREVLRTISSKSLVVLNGIARELRITVSNINLCEDTMSAHIQVISCDSEVWNTQNICKPDSSTLQQQSIDREFALDYFNFPKVDNTRLQHNHRLALVLTDTRTENFDSISLEAVIFPSDYASLRDRPGMKESLQMLQSALKSN